MGAIDTNEKISLFFEKGKKNKIINMIDAFKKNYDFKYEWEIQNIEPWHLAWKNSFSPIYIHNQIAIIPDWEEKIPHYEYIIKIKPGMAFGTGHHETTYLMLEALLEKNLLGKSVLDLGISKGTTNWQVFGSCKPHNERYQLSLYYDIYVNGGLL